jgi:predicted transposase YdaD
MAFPYDQSYKLTSDEDARGAITLVAGVAVPAEAEVESLDRELNLERAAADHIYRVRIGDQAWIHHFEALTRYRADWGKAQLDHAVAIERKYRLPVYSHLLVFEKRGAPEVIEGLVVHRAGSLIQKLEANVIRLWERPAAEVLLSTSVALYPWTALMNASMEEQREAARRLHASGRQGLEMQMALLGALRYGSRESFLERIGPMLLTKDILRDSPLWQEIEREASAEGLAKGMAEGLAEGMATGMAKGMAAGRAAGRAEGQADGERRALTLLLSRRFGPVPAWAEEQIATAELETLERWIMQAAVSESLAASLA